MIPHSLVVRLAVGAEGFLSPVSGTDVCSFKVVRYHFANTDRGRSLMTERSRRTLHVEGYFLMSWVVLECCTSQPVFGPYNSNHVIHLLGLGL